MRRYFAKVFFAHFYGYVNNYSRSKKNRLNTGFLACLEAQKRGDKFHDLSSLKSTI